MSPEIEPASGCCPSRGWHPVYNDMSIRDPKDCLCLQEWNQSQEAVNHMIHSAYWLENVVSYMSIAQSTFPICDVRDKTSQRSRSVTWVTSTLEIISLINIKSSLVLWTVMWVMTTECLSTSSTNLPFNTYSHTTDVQTTDFVSTVSPTKLGLGYWHLWVRPRLQTVNVISNNSRLRMLSIVFVTASLDIPFVHLSHSGSISQARTVLLATNDAHLANGRFCQFRRMTLILQFVYESWYPTILHA